MATAVNELEVLDRIAIKAVIIVFTFEGVYKIFTVNAGPILCGI